MGLIQFDKKRIQQPQGLAQPDQRWISRGLAYASTLVSPEDAVSGLLNTIAGTKPQATSWGMARGFGTSLGVGGTDKITTALDHITAARTYVVRIYRNGAGGGNFGRIFGNSSDLLLCDSAGNFLQFNRGFSTTGGAWKGGVGVGSTLNAPYVVGLSHDGSTSAPTMYRNGLGVAVTTITAPVGSITLTSSTFLVGNVAASTRVWDGYISDFYVFDSVLTAKEHEELASNIGALWRPRRIWVPVSAASGPPTLAAIAASDLTASGARLTVT